MLGGEPGVAVAIQLLHLEHLIDRGSTGRDLANAFVDQPVQTVTFIATHPAPDGAYVHVENLRHLLLAEAPGLLSLIELFEAHVPDLL